ncbi:MAG TPA: nodulation protein NfeD [Gammaproteobacteria bacterium]|nr:nodulation protein NfeD [Gammaproteobacteria bacterium]
MVNGPQGITKSLFRCLSLLLVILGAALLVNAQDNRTDRTAVILNVADAISPATWDYIHRGLEKARDRNAAVVILRLDTPGGLDTAMRKIIQDIIASPVPVIVYVSPSGARAASAGTYMMYASHIAAMAPGTNLGAATPVQLGGVPDIQPPTMPEPEEVAPDEEKDGENGEKDKDKKAAKDKEKQAAKPTGDAMQQKVLNDSIAYIRSLAEMRGRNVEWAEQAVREASSISADKALQLGVIDVVATDIDDLLEQADGWQVNVNGIDRTLDTGSLVVERIEPDWRNELLAVITNPNVAYILMLLGIYGLFFEFVNPGFVLPGVTGAICLLLALYALQVLPVNYAGLGLILLGIIFMVAEIFAPSFGALGIGGVISFVVGSVILFDTEGSNMQVAIPLIIVVSAVTAGFILVAVRLVFSSHRKPVVTGSEEMIGSIGEALQDFDGKGRIHIHGETWQAFAEQPVKQGDKVKVTELDGLVLKVAPIEEEVQ